MDKRKENFESYQANVSINKTKAEKERILQELVDNPKELLKLPIERLEQILDYYNNENEKLEAEIKKLRNKKAE